MTALVISSFAGIVGFIIGLLAMTRHLDRECEIAYLTGHIDGYTKAMMDSGEVPL